MSRARHGRPAPARTPDSYFDNAFKCEAVKILPGEYYATDRDIVLVTVLGSCVAACIRDRVTGVGGMNHFMLPRDDNRHPLSRSARYGAFAMEVLINQLLRRGARRESLEAKVFGGGAVIADFTTLNIGKSNATFVTDYLKKEDIQVAAEDLMGTEPRKVYFFPRSGRVLMRVIKRMHNRTILDREDSYTQVLNTLPPGGEIEIFK
ncbi:MAG: chemoreceptor glutamine deamidase CheD [Betaproteobacteria bacterium]